MALARSRQIRKLEIRVPGSTSNIGCGFDALSLALELPLRVRWEAAETTSIQRSGGLAESVLSQGQDPVLRGMRRAARLIGRKLPPGALQIHASLPPGRGLGASGAGLVAGLLLADRLLAGGRDRSALLQEAISLEGHPENAVAAMLGGTHWSTQDPEGAWVHHPVSLHRDLRFLLVIPPYPLTTKRAREVLPNSVSFARASAQAAHSPLLLEGLRTLNPQYLAVGLDDALHVEARLRQLTGARPILESAERGGALGATLSGAGSGLLVLARAGSVRELEGLLKRKVQRLWGETGTVRVTRPAAKGATFS